MGLLKRASGVLKDQNSLWQAKLSRRSALRNPEIEKSVILATSHHALSLDTRNAEHVCDWLRLSPSHLNPILSSISRRVERTRSRVVALKALHLVHTLTNTRAPCLKHIGRLPFDLSSFPDPFVRSYFSFLDHKSALISHHAASSSASDLDIGRELILLRKLQSLVDLLMRIKPRAGAAAPLLVLHAMDGVIIEIYDLYSRICRGIAVVLLSIYSAGKGEAALALEVVKKAMAQGEDLERYFQFCHGIGVVNAAEFPVIDRIPDEGIRELEEIIQSFVEGKSSKDENNGMRTIITDDWERFEDDFTAKVQEPPDLISFV